MANDRFKMNEEFFSGSQASIFIGDVWVDEITDWQCNVAANAQPIYGYGDTFFSHAAQGRVLVQGSFSINFREPNYLHAVLARYRKFDQLNIGQHATQEGKNSPSSAIDQAYGYNSDGIQFGLGPKKYEDNRKALDDFFYQSNEDQSFDNQRELSHSQRTGVVNNSIRDSRTLSDLDPRLVNDFAVPLFDIKIGYGSVINSETIGEQIVGVKLVGKGRTIMANGQPIKETYSFFAKNLV